MSRTSYDEIAYPTAVFSQATPDRLATMARVHGLSPPPIDTARVLEIGGGDAMNLLACAAGYPGIEGLSFDLAETAVERGRELAAAAGIGNVAIEKLDIVDAAAGAVDGKWDYVVAHGVYAWVPAPVRAALMRLIGRILSPDGVAFVSYNAKPGGHLRIAMREMLLHQLQGIEDAGERLAAAKAWLVEYSKNESSQEPIAVAMRRLATSMVERPDAVLHHDELGEIFEPQSIREVADAASAEGLLWLCDAGVGRLRDGFKGETDASALEAAHVADYADGRFFRQSLFVRSEARPRRTWTPSAVSSLFASCRAEKEGEQDYVVDSGRFEVVDAPLRDALDRLIAHWPGRLPSPSLFDDPNHLEALFQLFDAGVIELHAGDAPCALAVGERPVASPLVRVQLERGWPAVSTLDHRTLKISDERARAFLLLLDGSRDLERLGREWTIHGHGDEVPLDEALQSAARVGLMRA